MSQWPPFSTYTRRCRPSALAAYLSCCGADEEGSLLRLSSYQAMSKAAFSSIGSSVKCPVLSSILPRFPL